MTRTARVAAEESTGLQVRKPVCYFRPFSCEERNQDEKFKRNLFKTQEMGKSYVHLHTCKENEWLEVAYGGRVHR